MTYHTRSWNSVAYVVLSQLFLSGVFKFSLPLKYLLVTVQLAEFQIGLTKLALPSGHLSSSQVRLYGRLVFCFGDYTFSLTSLVCGNRKKFQAIEKMFRVCSELVSVFLIQQLYN